MPLYEYECDACHHRFEAIRKFSDAPLEACPKCGGSVRKLISASAFHLKGSGWYVTDYAKKDGGSGKAEGGTTSAKSADAKTSEGTDGGKPDGGAASQTETKSEAKADAKAEKAATPTTTPKP